eukprot:TRINITY_DN2032_c0_g1_i1.p1 TRINITY_DN2032_c0_g1~~TRINITY_DN2032_c0_g1_i1.p1  ORF type:complete len:192 (-),score=18.46 TRINITY_DN2032_c0_g1_i1:606-1181(-)
MDEVNKLRSLERMRPRLIVEQLISFGLIVTTALMIWKSLMILSASESPIVVVLSGSMEPGFSRGDLLFLYQSDAPFSIGEITVFTFNQRDIPIVHRILEVHRTPDGTFNMLTRGDANPVHDRALYFGLKWISRKHIMGRAFGYVPHLGMVTIWMNDYPLFKYGLITVLGKQWYQRRVREPIHPRHVRQWMR